MIFDGAIDQNARHLSDLVRRSAERAARAVVFRRLHALRADTVEAKAKIRKVLDALAIKYDIAVKDVTYAMAYADDMLADTVYNVERELEREIEGEEPV
jgi:hypothetical protein